MPENSHLRAFHTELQERFSPDAVDMTYSEWICKNTTLRNKPFNFDKFPFQKAICDDMSQQLVCKKISQVGLTEVQIRKAAAFCARRTGVSLIFTLPTDAMKKKLAQTRLQPFIESDKAFNIQKNAGVFQVRSTDITQIGQSFLFLTGDNESDATSTPADAVFNDEVDISDQKMLALFASRMQASAIKMNHKFSTPTFTDYGIDADYAFTNQREFMIWCNHCRHPQVPLFTEDTIRVPNKPHDIPLFELERGHVDTYHIDVMGATLHCERCGGELDLFNASKREWVAKAPHRHVSGYWVRPFSVTNLPPSYIINQMFEYKKNNHIRGWYNTVLGECYDGGDARLSKAEIKACFTGHAAWVPLRKDMNLFVGIDLGITCHVTIGEGSSLYDLQVLRFETVHCDKIEQYIDDLHKEFRVSRGGMDRYPYTPTANAIATRTFNAIVPFIYSGDDEIVDKLEDKGYYKADRTEHIDTLVRLIRSGTLKFSGYGDQQETIIEHLRDMVRVEEPEKKAVWKKLTGNDHYFHSLAFMTSAVKIHTGNYMGHGQDQPCSTVLIMPTTMIHNNLSKDIYGRKTHGLIR